MDDFTAAYKGLNTAQREAVDTIEGPVMVVAGPGTGKTQVLSLRIAHILEKTDTPANGILCLTFTRAGVRAMRERLARYTGARAREVIISTFHSFAFDLIEKHYEILGFEVAPQLVTDADAALLIDELLHEKEWKHLRPRGDAAKYFGDLKSLISLLKRERLTQEQFLAAIESDIEILQTSPDSISSRGESKGQLKKEVLKKLEALDRTREVVTFYEHYEALKKERGLIDYDDVLEHAVSLVEQSETVQAELRENFLYVLVDEHQDSSGVQNSFLEAVWKDTEKPNIFVVGDDRQLIYGFGGASLSYFEAFKHSFGKATIITLTENYRSTEPILSLADDLLKSSITTESLRSNRRGNHQVGLFEYQYPRDEIIAAALHFKEALASGIPAEECALLVPKNKHVRTAAAIFRDMGLPVRDVGAVSLFSTLSADTLRRALHIVANPFDGVRVASSLFDAHSQISPMEAHRFLKQTDVRNLSVEMLRAQENGGKLFGENDKVIAWGNTLLKWIEQSNKVGFQELLHIVGNELLIDTVTEHEDLMDAVEVVRTLLHLAEGFAQKHPKATLAEFLEWLDRLETYGQSIPVATLLGNKGISIVTLHGSKGLEYEHVWIAHMNESVVMSQRRLGFTLPESVEALVEAKDKLVATRELYVAITRAKARCTISYAKKSSTDGELELLSILADISQNHFEKKSADETEETLLKHGPQVYVAKEPAPQMEGVQQLIEAVKEEYSTRKVSVTLLNNFFECPWKWYFRNLLQLPEIKSEHQLFGSAVHEAIEQLLNGTLAANEKAVQVTVATYLEKEGIVQKAVLSRMAKEGTEVVMRWATNSLPTVAKDHTAERSLSARDGTLPHLSMYGKIDLTERFPDGTITVTDFKTGTAKTSGVIEKLDEEGRLSSHLRQLAMYSYLIREAEKKDVTTSRLLYLEEDEKEKNAKYTTHISGEQIDLLRRDITDYDRLVKSGEWVERPCSSKSYDGTECEYCKWAKEVYLKAI